MSLHQRYGTVTTSILAAMVATVAASCGGGSAPTFEQMGDQVGQVGAELKFEVRATDAEGDPLTYSFTSDVPNLGERAKISRTPTDTGLFRWTPVASDIGDWYFDFVATDGDTKTKTTVKVTIRSSIGAASAPVFRQPLGTGSTVDLTRTACVELSVVVEDQDTAQLSIDQEEPKIEGATIEAVSGTDANWTWCPTQAQADAESRYTLTLSADDMDNPKTLKNYLIVLRGQVRPNCPGTGPEITHSPADKATSLDVSISANIKDDLGLKQAPLMYYSETQPSAPVDVSQMRQLTMTRSTGDMKNGTWIGRIPNPVFDQPSGTAKKLYYVIVADDNDDAQGNCDHVTTSSTFTMTVTSTGAANAAICEPCSADLQCGSDGDLCVRVGTFGTNHCLQACGASGATSCPSGYTCSTSAVTSVNGASARQCVPISGSCSAVDSSCIDDMYEENDTRAQASLNPELAPDLYNLVSCPRTDSQTFVDDDWFKIVVPSDTKIDLSLAGEAITDLDLGLYKADGTRLSTSTSPGADEQITKCVGQGTYYTRIYGFGAAANPYLFQYSTTATTCGTCVDDSLEDDDNRSQARPRSSGNPLTLPYTTTGNKSCADDDDWYFVKIKNGETVKADLRFAQANSSQDLDLHFYDSSGIDLTPCTPANPSTCAAANGQSADANETMQQTISGCASASGCDYYFVVRGFANASNSYDITITKP
jgi:hypothetical protein